MVQCYADSHVWCTQLHFHYVECIKLNKKCSGICEGGQLTCPRIRHSASCQIIDEKSGTVFNNKDHCTEQTNSCTLFICRLFKSLWFYWILLFLNTISHCEPKILWDLSSFFVWNYFLLIYYNLQALVSIVHIKTVPSQQTEDVRFL